MLHSYNVVVVVSFLLASSKLLSELGVDRLQSKFGTRT